jgi:hypothetical protein
MNIELKKWALTALAAFVLSLPISGSLMAQDAAPAMSEDYAALLEGQGEHAYAYDFFRHFDAVDSHRRCDWSSSCTSDSACVESGMCQAKNTVNILFKNTFIISIGLIDLCPDRL